MATSTGLHAPITSCGTKRDQQQAATALAALADLERGDHQVDLGTTRIKLSKVDKVLYPAAGWRKLDVIRYYATIAPALLPHLRGRALTMKRYPDGVDGEAFYQKRCPPHAPSWVNVTEQMHGDGPAFCTVEDVRTLLWAANLADLELHVLLSKADDFDRPTHVAFDLDPGDGVDIVECCRVARWIRELLGDLGLESYPKTSGSKGLQMYVPINRSDVTFDDTKPFAHAVAKLLERQHPDHVVSKMLKSQRVGKVLVDWSQNDDHKTTICAYSLRARQQPSVSTPLLWDEVDRCAETADAELLRFTPAQVVDRVDAHGDLFEPVLRQRQQLPKLG